MLSDSDVLRFNNRNPVARNNNNPIDATSHTPLQYARILLLVLKKVLLIPTSRDCKETIDSLRPVPPCIS